MVSLRASGWLHNPRLKKKNPDMYVPQKEKKKIREDKRSRKGLTAAISSPYIPIQMEGGGGGMRTNPDTY